MEEEFDSTKHLHQIEDQINQITNDSTVCDESKTICRLCAQLIKQAEVVNLYNTLDIVQKINYALPITVSPGDGLPDIICRRCEDKLSNFHNFVCEVVKADKQLRTKLISPSDNVTKAIEEIFGTDSEDEVKIADVKPKQTPAVKRTLPNEEEPKKCKIVEVPPEPETGGKYICQRCGGRFLEFSTLLDHYKMQHGGKDLPCPEVGCNTTTKNEKQLREHIQDGHGIPVVCYKCGKIFLNQHALLKHQRNKHSAKVCNFCWMTFETSAGYESHLFEHRTSTQQQCAYCYKVYQTSRGLKRHTMHHHSGEITLMLDNIATGGI